MSEFNDWYKTIPQITRYWFTGSVAVPLIAKIGIISPMSLVLLFEQFFRRFQIWRPLTALLYYPITPNTGFNYLINLFFLYSYSSRLESGIFDGRPADFLFMLIFNWIWIVIIAFFLNIYILMDCMVLSVMYIWCQYNKDQIVSFWFGTRFKAMYLPWVLAGFNLIIRGGGLNEIVGIAIGHLYYFLAEKYPVDLGGPYLLNTPSILYKYFPSRRGPGAARPNANDRNNRDVGGRGYRLGD